MLILQLCPQNRDVVCTLESEPYLGGAGREALGAPIYAAYLWLD